MRTVYYYGPVEEDNITELLGNVREAMLAEQEVDEQNRLVRLFIVSEGGSLPLALHAYDMLRLMSEEYGIELHTIASGYCLSAGTVLLQAGKKRWAMPNALFMVHAPFQSTWSDEDEVGVVELQDRMTLHRLNVSMLAHLYAARSGLHVQVWFGRLEKPGRQFMPTPEALSYGLVDEVVPLEDAVRLAA